MGGRRHRRAESSHVSSRSLHSVLHGEEAVLETRGAEVVHVDPHVCAELGSLDHGERGVVGAVVRRIRCVVEHRGPEDGAALARLNGELELREVRLAALVHVVEVHEEGVDAHALRTPRGRVLVVVQLVELSLLVLDDLHEFAVLDGHSSDSGDLRLHALHHRVLEAFLEVAPALRGGTHRRDVVPCERALELVGAERNDAVRLLIGEEGVELQHVGVVE
mmetsp:Transcript_1243/g.3571  ORF Transcript_1243/g.3571 Transcript_1243/m.3571 type:complete len:220 (+) Transcript_1243:168-827(+)